ncbi:MAG: response regulator transcription factor, partial [Eggerthellaceae bacterium]|nr:response regulator transcription factor [Eggerthellaceae bacterium]
GMALFCVLLDSYRLGLALSPRIRNLFVGEPFLFTPDSVNFGIFAVCAAVLLAFFIVEIASMLRQAQNATVEAASEAMAEVDAIAAAKEAKYREGAFHYYLMQKFDLTQRESEVLRLFETGLSVKEIAEEQVVSESTIKTHLSNVYPKLGVKTRKDALKKVQSERENFFTA